jgi:hypothetical protein
MTDESIFVETGRLMGVIVTGKWQEQKKRRKPLASKRICLI